MHLRVGKEHGTMRKTKHRGLARVAGDFLLNLTSEAKTKCPIERTGYFASFSADC
jgi:hypothetical protein